MVHKYLTVREQVIAQAMKAPGNRVMSEHEICREFRVSRTTAVKALNSLATDKLVRREVGRGTFLQRKRANLMVRLLVNAFDNDIIAYAGKLAAAFTERNPDVDVQVDPIDSTGWVREIVTRPGTKVLLASHVGYLSDAGFLEPLHKLEGFDEVCGRILAEHIGWRRDVDGANLCDSLPLMLNPDALVIHRGHAERLGFDPDRGPADWKDLATWMSQARRLVHHGQPVMGAALKKRYILPLSYLCGLHGCRHIIRDDGTSTKLAFERGEEWLAFFQALHRSGAMPYYTADRPDPVLFGNALASPWASTWVVGQQRALANSEELSIVPIPPHQRGQPSCSIIGSCEVALVRQLGVTDRDRDAAWRLIQFMVGDILAQRILLENFSGLSILRELHAEQRAEPRFRPFMDALSRGVLRSDHPLQHPLLRIVHKYFNQCVLGDLSPSKAAARIVEGCALQLEIHNLKIG